MTIVLSKIYTRTGDEGMTTLGDMSRVVKTDPRLEAYGAVDEANAALGVVMALGGPDEELAAIVRRVQNDLFDVGADLCTPVVEGDVRLRINTPYVEWLEQLCDKFNQELPALRSFILPGGTPLAGLLHLARTAVRRAERRVWTLIADTQETTNRTTAQYLNRLADLLFVLARVANADHGDVTWQPGERQAGEH
jgi:cob(I)alamin adenosyltransferase